MRSSHNIIKTSQLPKLAVAVVGYGYWGQKLAATLKKLGQQVWLVDSFHLKVGQEFKQASWQEVLAEKKISAVVIATPEITHAQLVLEAVKAGKAVLVEKPAATQLADWLEIITLASQRKLPVSVDYTFLQSQALQSWVELENKHSQTLGSLIKLVSTRMSQLDQAKILAKKLPIWWDVVIHDIYLIKNVWGEKIDDWSILAPQPTQSAKITAKFGQASFEARYSWTEVPARSWVAEYEWGKLIWERQAGQELVRLYLAGKLIEAREITDLNPSPMDKVITNWLSLVSQPKFDKNYWRNYWQSVAEDIESIAQIDTVLLAKKD